MPNYVANIITVNETDERLEKFFEAVKGEESAFDFNRIIPMPEDLDIEDSSWGDNGMRYLLGEKTALDKYGEEERAKAIALGEKYLRNRDLYGATTWYNWRRWNWGTKWNACDVEIEGNTIKFDTAWSAPEPIYQKLAEMFVDYDVRIQWADEDYGYNTGDAIFDAGEFCASYPENGSDAAMELYFETHPYSRDEMHKDEDGNWVWNEE